MQLHKLTSFLEDLEEMERFHSGLSASILRQVGDLGWIHRGRLAPVLDEAAFSASIGKVVGPIKTIYGYHLILVTEVKEPVQLDFEVVQAAVTAELHEASKDRWVKELEEKLLPASGKDDRR